jgi:transposase
VRAKKAVTAGGARCRRPYSIDLREPVAAAREGHLSHAVLAALFRVGESTVRGWLRRARETGSVAPRPHADGAAPKVDAVVLDALVAERNDRTPAELAAVYGQRTGVAVSIHAIDRACGRLDLAAEKRKPGARRAGA